MQFLTHQKGTHQPKALSKSRQRDKRREDRELEEVSSFFLPQRADGNPRKSRPHSPSVRNNHHDLPRQSRQFEPIPFQELCKSPPLDRRRCSKHHHMPRTSRHDTTETPSIDFHGSIGDRQESDRNTSYFTWSSSRHSPYTNRREGRSSPDVSDSIWSTTPEPIRKDLIATGIYRDTGIPLYDDSLTEHGMERETTKTKNHTSGSTESEDIRRFNRPTEVKYRDQAIMTDNTVNRLEQHRRKSSTSEPRSKQRLESTSHNVHTMEDHQASKSPKDPSPKAPRSAQEMDRQHIVREARLGPPRGVSPRYNVQSPSILCAQSIESYPEPKPVGTGTNRSHERQRQETSDPASVASRDAMPPPPIPHGRTGSIATTRDDVEVGTSTQNDSSTNMATEVLRAPHVVNGNSDTQSAHGPAKSCDPATSSFETTSNTDQTLSSLDTLTWIPQRTPSARMIESRSIPSRPSMKSPIYGDPLEERLRGCSYQRDLTSKPHSSESMGEFIARIESESELQSPSHEYGVPGSESGFDGAEPGTSHFDTELLHEQPSVSYARENVLPRPASDFYLSYANLGDSVIDQEDEGELYAEAQYSQYAVDGAREFSGATQPFEDFEEERSEMSSFWRPNQFSQF